jgi:hypothetical protein
MSCLLLARNRHAGAVASCLLLGEERKWLGCAPRSQFDPTRTSPCHCAARIAPKPNLLFRTLRQTSCGLRIMPKVRSRRRVLSPAAAFCSRSRPEFGRIGTPAPSSCESVESEIGQTNRAAGWGADFFCYLLNATGLSSAQAPPQLTRVKTPPTRPASMPPFGRGFV